MTIFPVALLLSVAASADCGTRPASAAEKAAHKTNLAAFKKAAPPAPKGWAVEQEQDAEPLKTVCVGGEEFAVKQQYGRFYARVEGKAEQDAAAVAKVSSGIAKHQDKQKANAKELAAVDAQLDAAQKKLEAAAAKGDMAALQKISQDVERLSRRKSDLSFDAGGEAQAREGEADAARDASSSVEISGNDDAPVSLEECAIIKLPGADRACRAPRDGGVQETTILLGAWKIQGGEATPPQDPPKDRLRLRVLKVLVREHVSRGGALAKAVDLSALRALLKQP
jgi:hypothetical protein